MNNNDILRRLRFALNIENSALKRMMGAGGHVADTMIGNYLKKEDDEGFVDCPDTALAAILNGLIIERRGSRDGTPAPETRLNNNLVLKKCRIALSLRDKDMQTLIALGGINLSKPEINALCQRADHKNFKICGDQVLRAFLTGITKKLRPDLADPGD